MNHGDGRKVSQRPTLKPHETPLGDTRELRNANTPSGDTPSIQETNEGLARRQGLDDKYTGDGASKPGTKPILNAPT